MTNINNKISCNLQVSNELSFFDLYKILLGKKLTVFIVVSVFTAVAFFYTLTLKSQYGATVILKPGALNLYGELVVNLDTQEEKNIELGRDLIEQFFLQFENNLESRQNQAEFLNDSNVRGFNINSIRPKVEFYNTQKTVRTSSPKEIYVELVTLKPGIAIGILEKYFNTVGEFTALELDSFMSSLGGSLIVTKDMLYRVDFLSKQEELVVGNKYLIVFLGFVLGSVFSVFYVLVFDLLRKRETQ